LAAAQMQIRFQLNYRYQGANAPFLHAADSGRFAEAGLDVSFIEGISLTRAARAVAEGAADVGFGDAGHALELALRAGVAPVEVLMPIYVRSPCALGYLDGRVALRLVDLDGAALAGPDGDASARLLPMLLALNGLPELRYRFRTVTPSERNRLLAEGEVLAVTCFDATLRFSMLAEGRDVSRLAFLRFADHGLDLYTGSLVCSRALIAADPGLGDRLARVCAEAWRECRDDPDKGVAAVLRRDPSLDAGIVREHLGWVLANNVFADGRTGLAFDPGSARMLATVETACRAAGVARAPAALVAATFPTMGR
jgi:ABC-type nitrate/sulfonate/bicarbonate transport system substrate-binding protein